MDEKIEEKTKIPLTVTEKYKSNAKRVMEVIFFAQKPLKVNEISQMTGLKKSQIYRIIQFLNQMGSITKSYDMGKAKHLSPPRRIVSLSLNKTQNESARRWVMKNG